MRTSTALRWVMGMGCLVTASSCAGPRAVESSQTNLPMPSPPRVIPPAMPMPLPGSQPRATPAVINLAIDAEGQIIFDRSPVSDDRFPALLATLQERFGSLPVHLAADKTQAQKRAWVTGECEKAGLKIQAASEGK